MKEKLITFTRNRENLIWIVAIAILLVLPYNLIYNIEVAGMTSIGLISILIIIILMYIIPLLLFAIWELFDVDEEKIRKNNFFILLLSMNNYIWLPIFIVLDLIDAVIEAVLKISFGISFGILGSSIALICLVFLSCFLGNVVAKHFSKKIK